MTPAAHHVFSDDAAHDAIAVIITPAVHDVFSDDAAHDVCRDMMSSARDADRARTY